MNIEERIAAAEQELRRLNEEEMAARNRTRGAETALKALHAEKHGLVAGATVIVKDGKRYLFARVYSAGYHNERPWVVANVIRKDGTPGVERTVYGNWAPEGTPSGITRE